MVNLIKILIALVLTIIAIAFFAFAIQNNSTVIVNVTPQFNFEIATYLLVFFSVFAGFISAVVITRFEHIKNKLNIIKLLAKLKKHNKHKSKYISE